jgi:hypothetical protein
LQSRRKPKSHVKNTGSAPNSNDFIFAVRKLYHLHQKISIIYFVAIRHAATALQNKKPSTER